MKKNPDFCGHTKNCTQNNHCIAARLPWITSGIVTIKQHSAAQVELMTWTRLLFHCSVLLSQWASTHMNRALNCSSSTEPAIVSVINYTWDSPAEHPNVCHGKVTTAAQRVNSVCCGFLTTRAKLICSSWHSHVRLFEALNVQTREELHDCHVNSTCWTSCSLKLDLSPASLTLSVCSISVVKMSAGVVLHELLRSFKWPKMQHLLKAAGPLHSNMSCCLNTQ